MDDPKNAGIERPGSIWGDNPRLRNAILFVVGVLVVARIVTSVWLVEEYWQDAADWWNRTTAPAPVSGPVIPVPPAARSDLRTPPAPWAVPPADPSLANRPVLTGNIAQHFGPDSYPDEARDRGETGRVRAQLSIEANGSVVACRVVETSGSTALDNATCRQARRARFLPARDGRGAAVPSSYTLSVRWELPE